MATIIQGSRRIRFYVVAIALAALAITVLAVAYATGPAQAQPNPDLNVGKYADPQPCGLNVSAVPGNPDGEFNEGHVALFDAYWDYNTQTLNNNLCPPLAEHEVIRDRRGNVTGIVTARAQSNIDINETVFHAGNEFRYTITAADKDKYDFLPPAGTQSGGSSRTIPWPRRRTIPWPRRKPAATMTNRSWCWASPPACSKGKTGSVKKPTSMETVPRSSRCSTSSRRSGTRRATSFPSWYSRTARKNRYGTAGRSIAPRSR